MSDYISKSALLKLFVNLQDEHETNAISYQALYEVILNQPTLDEKEIIRKTAERIINRLEYKEKQYESRAEKFAEALNSWEESRNRGKSYSYGYAIEIVKEECGINE